MRTFVCWILANLSFLNRIGLALLLLFACAYYGFYTDKDSFEESAQWVRWLNTALFVIVPISFIVAIWASIFTYKNFDEVWSRRMRWANSNVDKFDARLKYAAGMFFRVLFAMFALFIIALAGLIYVIFDM